jgi:hypothetical protein
MGQGTDRRRLARGAGRRKRFLLTIVLAALLLLGAASAAPSAMAQQPPTTTTAGRCDNVSNPLSARLCQSQGTANQTKDAATGAASNVVSSAGDSALRGLTAAVAAAGGWVLEKVGSAITATTSPSVDAGWFVNQYQVMLALAMLLALPLLLFSIMQGMLRGDGSHIMRSAFIYLPLAGILSFVGPALVQLLIALADWMSLAVSANAASDAQKFMTETGSALTTLGAGTATPGVPVFGVLLGSLLILLGGFSIWLELLLRAAAIYVAVMFLPLGFAAMVWPAAWKWAKRLIEFLVAIVFAKVLIVAIISLAASGLANSGWSNGFEGVLAGGAMLLLAAASPAALLKLIPIAEAGIAEASNQRQALRRATYAGSLLTGSQVVSGMIQTRFRSNTALPAAAAAGAAGGAAGATAAAVTQARATTSAARNRVNNTLDNGATAVGAVGGGTSAPSPAPARPRPSPPSGPAGGGTVSGTERPRNPEGPFTGGSG